jgi:hypothetical protein
MSSDFIISAEDDDKEKLTTGSSMTKLLQLCLVLMTIFAPPRPASGGKGFLPPAPAANGKSFYFASPGACASSGQFSAEDCAAAFVRVAALIRERAPKFAEKYECVLQFKMCEADDAGYLPTTLGVEIVRSSKGLVARPMLAVETPGDLLRDPQPPTPGRDMTADGAPRWHHAGTGAASPYGVLALDATFPAPVAPPSLKSYRRYIDEVRLHLAASEQSAKPNPD